MRFALVDQATAAFPVHRLSGVLGVSRSGYCTWKDRPSSQRQRDDMVLLAHGRSVFALSDETSRHQADQAITRYIDGFYNSAWRHSALEYFRVCPATSPWIA